MPKTGLTPVSLWQGLVALGFGMTCRTNWETLQVQTESRIVLCRALSLFVLSLCGFQRNVTHVPESRSVNSSELLGRNCFSVSPKTLFLHVFLLCGNHNKPRLEQVTVTLLTPLVQENLH